MAPSLNLYKNLQTNLSNKRLEHAAYPKDLVIVAEGDSWFKYPLKKDILDYLKEDGFAIKDFSKAGDTLENMVFGSEYDASYVYKGPLSLQDTLNAITLHKPEFFLLSAGGNDIIGNNLVSFLRHKHVNPEQLINKTAFDDKIAQMRMTLDFYFKAVTAKSPNVKILMHGYDYPKVNGTSYDFWIFKVKGPWILPAMASKAIQDKLVQADIVKYFIDGYNQMLTDLSSVHENFYHIDLRGLFKEERHWDNEIHLNSVAYRRAANEFIKKMNEIKGFNPLEKFAANIIT
jgi:hypothetical protein